MAVYHGTHRSPHPIFMSVENSVDHEFLQENAEMEDHEEFDEAEQIDITSKMFKFVEDERIICFSENKLEQFDKNLRLVGSTPVDF